jgi:mono/diheme cytochrome c family protein
MKCLIESVTLLLGLLLIAMGIKAGQEPESAKTVKRVPVQATQAVSGKDLYREYCAVCHGTTGKGDGPAAAALKTQPADLTRIAKANGGKFPELRVQHLINGESEQPTAHGAKDMPVWGNIFRHMGGNPDLASVRVFNLMKFIQEMQEK